MPAPLKVFFAFGAYALLHSALLTRSVRAALEAIFGPRRFRFWFRPLYTAQAVLLLVLVVGYSASLPDATIAAVQGPAAWVLWVVRLAALGFIGRCVADLGVGRFLGLEHLRARREGREPPGDGVETGDLVVSGPYRWVRHPMYSAGFVALWSEPHWTVNRLAFVLAASLYLWLGSLHEERRLLRAYGSAYREYLLRTPRFVPRLSRS